MNLPTYFLFALSLAPFHAATNPAPQPEADVDRLISQLGHSSFADRESADQALREAGISAIDELAAAYRTSNDYETKLRIHQVSEYIYFWENLLKSNGFLGIQHQALTQPDIRIDEGKAGFRVNAVIPGTAAEQAGLKMGDVIVAVNGQTMPAGATAQEFASLIKDKPAGTPMVFEFFRGTQRMTKEIRIGFRPLEFYRQAGTDSNDLNEQYQQVMRGFPEWWTANFGDDTVQPPDEDSLSPTLNLESLVPLQAEEP